MNKIVLCGFMLSSAFAVNFIPSAARADDPLMGKSPWNFTPQNRAALAIAIKNIEDGHGAGGVGSGGGTTVLCGGTSGAQGDGASGAGASATANSNCVIISNSDGAIVTVDQKSKGDQDAGASSQSESHTTNNAAPSGSIDEVAAILGGRSR